ncbi:MAG: sugar ABC transporter permease YjfF, partial [Lachnospiraceae bacterium]|nr:sugar ABC transporter permease YjfF [Lachnospiraceae bacterium]
MKKRSSLNGHTILLLITIGLFIILYAGGCIAYGSKGFTHLQTFLNILITNAGLICVACGLTVVMLTAGIDISVGALIAMDCMMLAVGMRSGIGAIPMMLLVLLVGIAFGAFQGFMIGYLGIQPFIVTMAGMFFCRGMTAVICTDQVSITKEINETFYNLANMKINIPFGGYTNKKGMYMTPYIRVTVVVALIVLVVVYLMLRYTRFGRSLYAVGGNAQSAAMMGLNVKSIRMRAHMLCSVLASIGGICYCLNTMAGSVSQALGLEMDAISSAVIGGTLLTGGVGNVFGSFFGVLINGTISSIVKTNGKLASSWPNILTAILLFVFIVIQSIFAAVRNRSS